MRWVYGHVGSPKDKNYVEQRKALALRFRQKYRADQNGKSNVDAFFIGVFDTVASLGSYRTGFIVVAGLLAALVAASFVLRLLKYKIFRYNITWNGPTRQLPMPTSR